MKDIESVHASFVPLTKDNLKRNVYEKTTFSYLVGRSICACWMHE